MKKITTLILSLLMAFTLVLAHTPSVYAAEEDVTVSIVSIFDNDNVVSVPVEVAPGSVLDISDFDGLPGYSFRFWIVNGVVRHDLGSGASFLATDGLTIIAVYSEDDNSEHPVVFMDTNGHLIGEPQFVSHGDPAQLPSETWANFGKPGYTLVLDEASPVWKSAAGSSLPALIDSPSVFVLTYTLTDPFATVLINEESYPYNSIQTFTSADPEFSYWADAEGNVISYANPFKTSAIFDRVIVASTEEADETPTVYMLDVTGIREDHRSFLGQYFLPAGYEVVEFGFVIGEEVVPSNALHPTTNEFLRSFSDENEADVVAYLTFKYDNVIFTTYSGENHADVQAATAFVELVDAIGEVDLDSASEISAALTAYNALSAGALAQAGVEDAHETLLVLLGQFDNLVLTTEWTTHLTGFDTVGTPSFNNGVWSYSYINRPSGWWTGTWGLNINYLAQRTTGSQIYVVFRSVAGESFLFKGNNDFDILGGQTTVVATGGIQILQLNVGANNNNLTKLEIFSKNQNYTGSFEVFSISNTVTSGPVIAELNAFASSVSEVLAIDSFSSENETLMSDASAEFEALSFEARVLALGLNEQLKDAIEQYNEDSANADEFLLAVAGLPSVEDEDILDYEEDILAAKVIFDQLTPLARTKAGVQDAYDDFAELYVEFVTLVNLRDADLFLQAYDAIGEVTTDSGSAITAAFAAYEILSAGAKSVVVTEYADLLSKEATYYALVFIAEVAAIDVTLESEADIEAAFDTYSELSAASLLVTGVDAAYASLLDKEATFDALVYIDLVDQIGVVAFDGASLAKIVAAENAYAALSVAAEAKDGVEDAHSDMVSARNTYNELKDESDAAAFVVLVEAIDEEIDEESEPEILAAEAAWDALSANAKQLPNAEAAHAILVAARETFGSLDRTNMINEFLDAVAAVDDPVTLDSKDDIDGAYNLYEDLLASYEDAGSESAVIAAKATLDGYLADYQALEFAELVGLLAEDPEDTLEADLDMIEEALEYYDEMLEAAQALVSDEYAHLLAVKAYWDEAYATFAGYIAITSAAEFHSARNDTSNNYYLANDITVATTGVWNAFLDGNGKKITATQQIITTMNGTIQNANIEFTTSTISARLIETINASGVIKNSRIVLTKTAASNPNSGTLAQTMSGTVSNVIITLTHNITANPGAEPISVARVFYTATGTVNNSNVLMILNCIPTPALNNFAQHMRVTCGATNGSANTHEATGTTTYVTTASLLNYTAAKYPAASGWSSDVWNFQAGQVPTLKVMK